MSRFEFVYEPSDDSWLFMDALAEEKIFLEALNPLICVEIGVGSGVLSACLSKIIDSKNVCFVGTDINPHALQLTRKTFEEDHIPVFELVRTSLVDGCDKLKGNVDVLLFNPPYVLSSDDEIISKDWILRACSGGKDGRRIIDLLLPKVESLLSRRGISVLCYFINNRSILFVSDRTE